MLTDKQNYKVISANPTLTRCLCGIMVAEFHEERRFGNNACPAPIVAAHQAPAIEHWASARARSCERLVSARLDDGTKCVAPKVGNFMSENWTGHCRSKRLKSPELSMRAPAPSSATHWKDPLPRTTPLKTGCGLLLGTLRSE